MKLNPEYTQELIDLEEKMFEAQRFAEKLPAFAENILKNKFTKETTGKIASTYKGLYFPWGINRHFYRARENITNYRGDFDPQYLWSLYINEISLFGDNYTDTGVDEIKDSVDVFFFDHLNTTFYATDDQIIALLDALADWYAKAKEINNEFRKEEQKRKLKAQLDALEQSA